jgi:hypothetical protein
MASIILNGPNSAKRIENTITRVLNAADGYRLYIDNTTTPSIADVVSASGVIDLTSPYVPGRFNLQVVVNGLIRSNPGGSLVSNDYVELSNTQIQLGNDILATLTANPSTSNIEIRWNRHWPGVRDALLSNLQNVDQDIEDAVLDTGTLRALAADASNPLATLADTLPTAFSGSPDVNQNAGSPLGNMTPLSIPAGTLIMAVFIKMGESSPQDFASGTYFIDVASGLMWGGYQGMTLGGGTLIGVNPATSGQIMCRFTGSLGSLSVQTSAYTGAGGSMTMQVAENASATTSINLSAVFLK